MSQTKIKICGLFRPEDIACVNQAHPDYVGFVFAKSRRQVSPQQAKTLVDRLAPGITPVGVFVDAPISQVIDLLQTQVIQVAQLHGGESEAYIEKVKAITHRPVIKSIVVQKPEDILLWQNSSADFLLLDYGAGDGQSFDWALTAHCNRPYFLAGGICAANLPQALTLAPYGIDISSGAETDGLKDAAKIADLVATVRQS